MLGVRKHMHILKTFVLVSVGACMPGDDMNGQLKQP